MLISVTLLMWFVLAFPVIYIKTTNRVTDNLTYVHKIMFFRIRMHELLTSAIAEFHIIKTSYCREHVAQIVFKKPDVILSDGFGQ